LDESIATRRSAYFKFNSQLAQLDDRQVRTLLKSVPEPHVWGSNGTVKLGGKKLFVKRLPLTKLEAENGHGTKNLYRLPTYYNYGVGSAGFGVFREILTHIKTSNWVLDGAIENFPLMYHYRIIPFHDRNAGKEIDGQAGYIEYWNSSKNVEKLVIDRSNAACEAVLFLEYIPHTLWSWLDKHMEQLDELVRQMQHTLTFLRQNDIIHFDAHLGNILTDGRRFYLTDFGLSSDKIFALDKRERAFFTRHRHYDCGEFISAVCDYICLLYRGLSNSKKVQMKNRYGADEKMPSRYLYALFLERIDEIHDDGIMDLPPNYVDFIKKHHATATLMNDFFIRLVTRNQKDAIFNGGKLRRFLKEAGFV